MIHLPRRQGQWLHGGEILPMSLRLRSRRPRDTVDSKRERGRRLWPQRWDLRVR
jgi:hypothetical protein